MLNKQGSRELAYLVKVDGVEQMNADRLEAVDIFGQIFSILLTSFLRTIARKSFVKRSKR